MAHIREDTQLIPSILDRLIDEEPDNSRETPKSRNQVLRELKQSVRRDLENLLNTRWRCVSWPPNLDELDLSLVNYGIPDFSGAAMGDPNARRDFVRVIEHVIRKFEPRFKSVDVKMLDSGENLERSLRFRIDALLYAEPAPEPVIFDSQLEPVSGTFQVKSGNR